ncbi:MAG: hypothetical protein V2A63_02995 [Patescibacteria group bacterium]
MKKIFLVSVFAIFFAACTAGKVVASKMEYEQVLGKAVCEVVKELNAKGELKDEAAIARDFNPLFEQSINVMGYDSDSWLAAKTKYFPNEEDHTKLVKLHFTWCLIGDSIGGTENATSADSKTTAQ